MADSPDNSEDMREDTTGYDMEQGDTQAMENQDREDFDVE